MNSNGSSRNTGNDTPSDHYGSSYPRELPPPTLGGDTISGLMLWLTRSFTAVTLRLSLVERSSRAARSRPEIVSTPNGPAVLDSNDFSLVNRRQAGTRWGSADCDCHRTRAHSPGRRSGQAVSSQSTICGGKFTSGSYGERASGGSTEQAGVVGFG